MPCVAVSVTDAPGQSAVVPLAVMVAIAVFETVTAVAADVAEQLPLFTVTLYCPALETTIDCEVAPFDH